MVVARAAEERAMVVDRVVLGKVAVEATGRPRGLPTAAGHHTCTHHPDDAVPDLHLESFHHAKDSSLWYIHTQDAKSCSCALDTIRSHMSDYVDYS